MTGTFAGVVPVHTSTAARSATGARGPMVERLQALYARPGRRRRRGARRRHDRRRRAVAIWSGPRNISTAMMRAWENRPDTVVVDEPLYAAYLARTGLDHPGRDEVIAAQPTDLADVVAGARARRCRTGVACTTRST